MKMINNGPAFIGCESEYERAKIVLFGAPYDGTSSYRAGSRFAGSAMRSESFAIETYSPYQDKDLGEIAVFDAGDLELAFGNTARALDEIETFVRQVLDDGKMPVMLGGEHLVTLGAVRAVRDKYPHVHIIHFDAHTDLRDDYLGEKLSHATVMRRVWELLGDGRVFQFGIRSGDKSEFEWAKGHVFTNRFNLEALPEVVERLKGVPVYVTIDLDVMDPSIFPGTGTPEAGGVSFKELLEGILLFSGLDIVGCDVNELAPGLDTSGVSTAVACKVLRELLLVVGK